MREFPGTLGAGQPSLPRARSSPPTWSLPLRPRAVAPPGRPRRAVRVAASWRWAPCATATPSSTSRYRGRRSFALPQGLVCVLIGGLRAARATCSPIPIPTRFPEPTASTTAGRRARASSARSASACASGATCSWVRRVSSLALLLVRGRALRVLRGDHSMKPTRLPRRAAASLVLSSTSALFAAAYAGAYLVRLDLAAYPAAWDRSGRTLLTVVLVKAFIFVARRHLPRPRALREHPGPPGPSSATAPWRASSCSPCFSARGPPAPTRGAYFVIDWLLTIGLLAASRVACARMPREGLLRACRSSRDVLEARAHRGRGAGRGRPGQGPPGHQRPRRGGDRLRRRRSRQAGLAPSWGRPILGTTRDLPEIPRRRPVDQVIVAIPSATAPRAAAHRRSWPRGARLPGHPAPRGAAARQGVPRPGGAGARGDVPEPRRRGPGGGGARPGSSTDKTVLVTGAGRQHRQRAGAAARPARGRPAAPPPPARRGGDAALRHPPAGRARRWASGRVAVLASVRDLRGAWRSCSAREKPDVILHAAALKHVAMCELHPLEADRHEQPGHLPPRRPRPRARGRELHPRLDGQGGGARLRHGRLEARGRDLRAVARARAPPRASPPSASATSSAPTAASCPLFHEQIARGGPVTVTDPRATRFFMTIPEACGLILQATRIAQGGEVYVLDMGEPVRVLDLAHNLIRLYGYEPGKDIEVKIIGLRPGEKLHESLVDEAEEAEPIRQAKLLRIRGRRRAASGAATCMAVLERCLDRARRGRGACASSGPSSPPSAASRCCRRGRPPGRGRPAPRGSAHVPVALVSVLAIIPARSRLGEHPRQERASPSGASPCSSTASSTALAARNVDRVIVSTDSPRYRDIARGRGRRGPLPAPGGAGRRPLDRPRGLRPRPRLAGRATRATGPRPASTFAPPTPRAAWATWRSAVDLLLGGPDRRLRAIGDVRAPHTPYKMWRLGAAGTLQPLLAGPSPEPWNLPRQVLPEVYLQNAAVDVVRSPVVRERRSMTGGRVLAYLMDDFGDIDEWSDLAAAEHGPPGGRDAHRAAPSSSTWTASSRTLAPGQRLPQGGALPAGRRPREPPPRRREPHRGLHRARERDRPRLDRDHPRAARAAGACATTSSASASPRPTSTSTTGCMSLATLQAWIESCGHTEGTGEAHDPDRSRTCSSSSRWPTTTRATSSTACRIISEMGQIAGRHGIQAAVKLQYRDLDTFIHPDYRGPHRRQAHSRASCPPASPRATSAGWSPPPATRACSPWSRPSTRRRWTWRLEHEVDILKVASCSALDWPLLEAIAGRGQARHLLDGRQVDPRHRQDRELLRPPLREGPGPAPLRGPLPDPRPRRCRCASCSACRSASATCRSATAGTRPPTTWTWSRRRWPSGPGSSSATWACPARARRSTPTPWTPPRPRPGWRPRLRMREHLRRRTGTRASRPRRSQSLHQLTRGTFARRRIGQGRGARAARTCSSPCPAGRARPRAGSSSETMVASRDYEENEPLSREPGPRARSRSCARPSTTRRGCSRKPGSQLGSRVRGGAQPPPRAPAVPALRGGDHQPAQPRVLQEAASWCCPGSTTPATSTRSRRRPSTSCTASWTSTSTARCVHLCPGDMQLIERGQTPRVPLRGRLHHRGDLHHPHPEGLPLQGPADRGPRPHGAQDGGGGVVTAIARVIGAPCGARPQWVGRQPDHGAGACPASPSRAGPSALGAREAGAPAGHDRGLPQPHLDRVGGLRRPASCGASGSRRRSSTPRPR